MHTKKTAITAAPIAPVLAERWSPRAFDSNYVLTQDESLSLLEAARWAASSNNMQPWRFSVLNRGEALFDQAVATGLTGFNQAWAPRASQLIVLSVPKTTPDGSPYQIAFFDAGLATSNLLTQATELGLSCHVIGGLVREELCKTLGLDDNLEVVVAIAVGKIAPAETLEGPAYEREIQPRVRLTLDDIVLHGKP
jgi:nitroreductase